MEHRVLLVLLRALCLGAGYLFGSFLTAELVCRCTVGTKAAKVGNGNPGMANIWQSLGPGPGLLVLAGDALKTAAACWFCYFFAAPEIGWAALLYAGLGAVLGHDYPLRHIKQGGKGVAVTCTWLLLAMPVTGLLCCLAGGVLVLWLGYLPLGAVAIPLLAAPLAWLQLGLESGLVVLAAALLMLYRHRRGLQRIAHGQEPKFFRRSGGE